jgi:hypothetical protein
MGREIIEGMTWGQMMAAILQLALLRLSLARGKINSGGVFIPGNAQPNVPP